jgi:hypothetical protein
MTERRTETDLNRQEAPPSFSDATTPRYVREEDMTHYSSRNRLNALRGPDTSAVHDVEIVDSLAGPGDALMTLPHKPGDRGSFTEELKFGDLRRDLPGSSERLKRDIRDLLSISPPGDIDTRPTEANQIKYRSQAREIAALLTKNGDFYAGFKRENIEGMFEDATRNGEGDLNFLVKAVNAELAKTNPNLQLGYSFGSDKAWFTRDTHGASVYYAPVGVDENRSTVSVVSRANGKVEMEDVIRSRATASMPGFVRVPEPDGKLRLLLDRTGT